MSDDVDVVVILASSTIKLAAARFYLTKCSREKGIILSGFEIFDKNGAYNCLMRDLEVYAEEKLKNYIRFHY